MYHCLPGGGLGAAAVHAAGTPEQKAKFLARFNGEKPTFAAMCITEAGAGSDNSAIRTRAVLDEKTNEWVINGEKIFVTGGDKSFTEYEKLGKGYIVIWATIDPSAGRAGMRAFVVEGGTPGVKIIKLEHKLESESATPPRFHWWMRVSRLTTFWEVRRLKNPRQASKARWQLSMRPGLLSRHQASAWREPLSNS